MAPAVHGPRSRHFVAGLLWPECPEGRALDSLRTTVFNLSRQAPGALVCHGGAPALSETVDADLHHLLGQLLRPVVGGQARLQGLYVIAVEERAELCPAQGDVHHALAPVRTVCDAATLREGVLSQLIRAHLGLGNEAEAWRVFRGYRCDLAQGPGEQPSARVRGLLEPVRRR